jgi:hypothetical protein
MNFLVTFWHKVKIYEKEDHKEDQSQGDELSGDSVTLSGEELLGYNISKKKKAKNLNKLYGKPAYLKELRVYCAYLPKIESLQKSYLLAMLMITRLLEKRKHQMAF